jgi:hypothetical protein
MHKFLEIGDIVQYQCKDDAGNWTVGMTCNDGKEMTIFFGKDYVFHCGWTLTQSKLRRVVDSVQNDERWSCRMEMAPNTSHWIPFSLPFWGIVEPNHIHLINHFNFVFHANEFGYILGVAAYPVYDQFQFVTDGTTLFVHGVVKWFKGHNFRDLSSESLFLNEGRRSLWIPILMWSFVTFSFSFVTAVLLYYYVLKPRLMRKILKVE